MIGSIAPSVALRGIGSIVGVGETDYGEDYAAWRAGGPDYVGPSVEEFAERSFSRALEDCGLERDDVDGLISTLDYGAVGVETIAKALSVQPRFSDSAGSMAGIVANAVTALAGGRADTVAVLYASRSRGSGRQFGGDTYVGADRSSYYYYHPWGWSAQAAHWALMFRYYQETYGATEADLGSVAVELRQHALRNPNAIMQKPLSIDEYLASRYIVRPLHLFDLCIPNDGSVCLILRRTDEANDLRHIPVAVAGWADVEVTESKMHHMVKERLRTQLQAAGRGALEMAGVSLADVQHFEGYDASTIHLINQIEGYGFVEPGQGLAFCQDGQMDVGGRLPTNISGGLLSEAYMHGWNHLAEAARQLRHEAGDRQILDVTTTLFSLTTTESSHPLVLRRADA
ncbi:MAG TPA: thiolase family protein [Acidimicrobiales bacterium]|nr:thiolase family protein [Acidimicrobiales bacterium]